MSSNEAGGGPSGQGDLSERLKRLKEQLDRHDPPAGAGKDAPLGSKGGTSPLGQAMQLSSEFIGGVLVGGALGWGFDYLFGTKPWGLIFFLMLGFVSAVYNVMRRSGFSGTSKRGDGGTL